jgi:hypothetical protein
VCIPFLTRKAGVHLPRGKTVKNRINDLSENSLVKAWPIEAWMAHKQLKNRLMKIRLPAVPDWFDAVETGHFWSRTLTALKAMDQRKGCTARSGIELNGPQKTCIFG